MGFWVAQCGRSENHPESGTPWDGTRHSDQYAAYQDLHQHQGDHPDCVEDGEMVRVTYYGDDFETQPIC